MSPPNATVETEAREGKWLHGGHTTARAEPALGLSSCELCGLLCQLLLPKLDGRMDEEVSFWHVPFFPPPKGPCVILMLGNQEIKECSSSQSGCIIEAAYRVEKIQDWCSHVSFKSCLLCKIDTKSHVLVPSQSKGDAHGREKVIML